MVEGFVPQVPVQEERADGLGVVDRVEGGPVQVGDQGVAYLPGEVEHPAHGRRAGVPVRVEPAGQRLLVGDVERGQDGLGAQGLQLPQQGDGAALGGGGVGAAPLLPGRDGGAPHQDEPAGPSADEGAAQEAAQRAEGAGDQVAAVGPQPERQGPGQAFGGAEPAGTAASGAQRDLLLVVAQHLAQQCLGVGAHGVRAGRRQGVEVDQLPRVAHELLVAQHTADAPRGGAERFDGLAGQDGLGSPGHDVQAAADAPGEQDPGQRDQRVGARTGVVAECLTVAPGEVGPVEVPQVQDGSAEGSAVPVDVGEEAFQIGRGSGLDGVRAAGHRLRVSVAAAHQSAAFAPGLGEDGEGVGHPVVVCEEQPAVLPCRGGRALGRWTPPSPRPRPGIR